MVDVSELETCPTEPFVSDVTPQADDPSSLELFQQQIESYLQRLREAVCNDLTALAQDTAYSSLQVVSAEVDLPNIGSNGSQFLDVTVADTPLGTHILSFAPLTDATSIDDLLIQIMVIAEDTVRVTMQNPTAGGIDPDPITFQFILATI